MDAEAVVASVLIEAGCDDVYRHFVDPEAMVEWMGERAWLDPRPGGRFAVDVEGTEVRGRYIELDPPHRLVLSWGFAGSDELPPGASRVEVRLMAEGTKTRVELRHVGLRGDQARRHSVGWRHFGERLARAAGRPKKLP